MQDEMGPEAGLIWGIAVPLDRNGTRRWPSAIKRMAAERVAAGARISQIAREIGARDCTVRKWFGGAEEPDQAAPPAFVEVLPPARLRAAAEPRSASGPKPPPETGICRIRIGDAEIAVSPSYPAAHLTEVLRAVRATQ